MCLEQSGNGIGFGEGFKSMTINLKQLSKLLKLSPTTVSRALADYPDVSAKTRAKVKQMAIQQGYQPNPVARRLQKGKTETIGIVITPEQNYFSDTFFIDLLSGISNQITRAGYELILGVASDEEHEMQSMRRMVEGKRVDGMILTLIREQDPRVGYLLDRDFPFVLYGRTRETRPYAFVDMDGKQAFEKACTYLAGLGHRRIALLNGEPGFMFPVGCREGYESGLFLSGLELDPDLIREWKHKDPSQSSYRWTLELFKNDNPPTAILFQTEAVNGIFKGLDELNLQPGKDVALIGYDDLEIARIHRPSLSVLRPQAREAGQRVVNILMEVIKGEDPGKFQEIHQVEMVIRETSLPPS